ncbi:Protein of unknown function [Bacillus wiedmannii]|nr:Protein of unknown function [Bacillus wiedmannii]
MQYYVIKKEAY